MFKGFTLLLFKCLSSFIEIKRMQLWRNGDHRYNLFSSDKSFIGPAHAQPLCLRQAQCGTQLYALEILS